MAFMFSYILVFALLSADVRGFLQKLPLVQPATIDSRSCTRYGATLSNNVELDEMRKDIEDMREEAIRRLDALNEQIQHLRVEKSTAVDAASTLPDDSTAQNVVDMLDAQSPAKAKVSPSKMSRDTRKLLDGTRWRVSLDIGREPGTWMPESWGASGDRLRMSTEIEFSSDHLYDTEDFLNGISGSKKLRVIQHEVVTSPTMSEGSKVIQVADGGWRVAPGEGPLGTDIVRFYFELMTDAQHKGSDVNCPRGRVYCTCGYFPIQHNDPNGFPAYSLKDQIREEQKRLSREYLALEAENESDKAFFSVDKIRRSKKMFEMRMEASRLERRMNEAKVLEPERSLLRLSQNQDIGLTREGGVCSKFSKGLAVEYRILGRFEIASMPNRDHAPYNDLLP